MGLKNQGPPPACNGAAGEYRSGQHRIRPIWPDQDADRSLFPLCVLYGVRLVDCFPCGCPLKDGSALAAVGQIAGAGWAELGNPCGDKGLGLALIERAEICDECVGRLLPQLHVGWLRDRGAG